MSSGGQVIGAGVVQVTADDTKFRDALNKLPAVAQQQIDLTMRSIQDRIARTQLKLSVTTDPDKIRQLQAALDMFERRLNQTKLQAIEMGDRIKGGAGDASQGLLRLGQAIDDIRFGFASVINNIPGLVTGFGGSAGVAGAVSIASIAVFELYTHWDKLLAAMGNARPIMSQSELMDRLAESIKGARNELEKFEGERTKRREERIQKEGPELLETRTDAEEEAEERVRKAVKTAGGENVREGIRQTMKAEIEQLDPFVVAQREKIAAMQKEEKSLRETAAEGRVENPEQLIFRAEAIKAQIETESKNLKAREEDAINRIAGESLRNERGMRERLTEAARRNPAAFGPEGAKFAGELMHATPADVEADRKAIAKHELDKEEAKQKEKAAADAAASEEKIRQLEAAEMNKAGEEFKRAQEREASRFSGAMARGAIGSKLLQNPEANVSNDIKAQLMANGKSAAEAGILAPFVAEQIKKDIEGQIIDYIARHPGATKATAGAAIVAQEKAKQEKKAEQADQKVADARERVERAHERLADVRRGPGASFSGLTEFARSTQLGALNQADRQKELIEATKAATKAEQELTVALKNKTDAAVAAP